MNDTEALRTQYVDDLTNQRQSMEDAMKYQNSPVTAGEGFSTMVPKVAAMTGFKPKLPFINFAFQTIKTLPDLNFNGFDPANFRNVFRDASKLGSRNGYSSHNETNIKRWSILDLNSIVIFRYINDFSYMFSGRGYDIERVLKLGKNFDLSSATTTAYMFANVDRIPKGCLVYLFDIDEIPKSVCKNLEDVSYMCAIDNPFMKQTKVGNFNFCGLAKLLTKIYNAPVKTIKGLFADTEDSLGDIAATDVLIQSLDHMAKYWNFSNLEDISELCEGRGIGDGVYFIANWLKKLKWNKVKDISNMFGGSKTNGSYNTYSGEYDTQIDLSMFSFDAIEKASYTFRIMQFTKISLGPALNKTVENIQGMFYADRTDTLLKTINIGFWDLGKVTNCGYCFNNRSSLEELYFGWNLGAGFTQKSNNYNYYTVSLTSSNLLSVDSVLYMFDKIYDLNIAYGVYDSEGNPGSGKLYTQKIDLHADVIAKLTPEQIAIATNKGWTVV